MKTIVLVIVTVAILLIGITGVHMLMQENGDEGKIPPGEQTGYTDAVPSEYLREARQKGTVETLQYQSRDYVRDSSPITKTAYVYLPYGYDDSVSYDILYLMHGWGGHAGEYFEYGNVKEMLDNMIERGIIEPLIVVSPSFYNSRSSTDFSSSIAEFRQFYQDFRCNLMPAVESEYSTYASSVNDEDLISSRDHRAFGGFSLGAVTTWLQFCENSDYIRYFLPMSGSSWYYGTYGDFQIQKNVDHIEEVVRDHGLDDKGYMIYHTVGTADSVRSQTIDMATEMLSREIFTSENYLFYQKQGGQHDYYSVREFIYNALPFFFPKDGGEETAQYFTKGSGISDVVNDDAFEGFGRLIFPANSSYYFGNTLDNLRLTWYSGIDANKTVEIVNYMKSESLSGRKIFYDIYSENEKAMDRSKEDTGLFFFKGKDNAPFAIVNAGGGMVYVGAMHDSFPQALELSKKGYNAFALIYRPGFDTAMEDLARAIAFIHEHQDELGVDIEGYSLWGGSAGARIAAELGSHPTSYYGEEEYPRPSAVIMQYTGYSTVYGNEPATYNCVGTSDGIASYRTMQNRIDALRSNGTDAMIEVFDGLPHGFGLGTGTVAEGWFDRAVTFWEKHIGD